MRPRTLLPLAFAAAAVAAGGAVAFAGSGSHPVAHAVPVRAPSIKVAGNHIVTAGGQAIQIRGVNRPGPEYAAAEGWGIFDGPTDDKVSIAHIRSWHVNAVRVPLNEDSWLGINHLNPTYNGTNYRIFITDYVRRLNAGGMLAIINLHFGAPGYNVPNDQWPMADADHSPAFWKSVATAFKANHSVIFDLFNEPFPGNNLDTPAAWSCVLHGGICPGLPYKTAGMQQLVNVVRATGATQPIMLAGPQYAGVLDRWLQYEPNDPRHQLIASVHIYGPPLDSPYRASSRWNQYMGPLAKKVPVVIGEFGDTDCTTRFSPSLMKWADAHVVGYVAWGWIVGNCAQEPSLITNYNGTPSKYGIGVRNHLLSRPNAW